MKVWLQWQKHTESLGTWPIWRMVPKLTQTPMINPASSPGSAGHVGHAEYHQAVPHKLGHLRSRLPHKGRQTKVRSSVYVDGLGIKTPFEMTDLLKYTIIPWKQYHGVDHVGLSSNPCGTQTLFMNFSIAKATGGRFCEDNYRCTMRPEKHFSSLSVLLPTVNVPFLLLCCGTTSVPPDCRWRPAL